MESTGGDSAVGIFGVGYNAFVSRIERSGHNWEFTTLLMVGGTLATLGGSVVLIGWEHAVLVCLCFVAGGTPMIIDSSVSYARMCL
jgi:hypothetical protein